MTHVAIEKLERFVRTSESLLRRQYRSGLSLRNFVESDRALITRLYKQHQEFNDSIDCDYRSGVVRTF